MNTQTQLETIEELSIQEKKRAYLKAYHEANMEAIKAKRQLHYKLTKETRKDYYHANKHKWKINYELRRDKIKDYQQAYHKNYREANKDKINVQRKFYREANRKYLNARRRDYLKTNPLIKFTYTIRINSSRVFKRIGKNKPTNTIKLLGCTWQEAKEHFERLFQPGMTWANHGRGPNCWHVDHIIPIVSATTMDEAIKLNHISNLQPLWSKDNLAKGIKITQVSEHFQ